MKNYSISQFKLFHKSQAERAWKYILWLPTQGFWVESMIVWNIIETYITIWWEIDDIIENQYRRSNKNWRTYDKKKIESKVRWWLLNWAEGLKIKWEYQVKVDMPLHWKKMLWYIDVLQWDTIIDIKTTWRKVSIDTDWFYWMSKQEEYELQLWYYMKATNKRKAKIIEIITFEYEKWKSIEPIEYEMNRTEGIDEKRSKRTKEKIEVMDKIRKEKW